MSENQDYVAELDRRARQLLKTRGSARHYDDGGWGLTLDILGTRMGMYVDDGHLHVVVNRLGTLYCNEWESCRDYKLGSPLKERPVCLDYQGIKELVLDLRPEMVLDDMADV